MKGGGVSEGGATYVYVYLAPPQNLHFSRLFLPAILQIYGKYVFNFWPGRAPLNIHDARQLTLNVIIIAPSCAELQATASAQQKWWKRADARIARNTKNCFKLPEACEPQTSSAMGRLPRLSQGRLPRLSQVLVKFTAKALWAKR